MGNQWDREQTHSNRRALIIEDDLVSANVYLKALRREGFVAFLAHDGMSGFEKAVQEKPDVILLDLMLPGIDGIATLERIRSHKATQNIPTLVVSATPHLNWIPKAKEAGASATLSKSSSTSIDVIRVIQELLRASDPAPTTELPTPTKEVEDHSDENSLKFPLSFPWDSGWLGAMQRESKKEKEPSPPQPPVAPVSKSEKLSQPEDGAEENAEEAIQKALTLWLKKQAREAISGALKTLLKQSPDKINSSDESDTRILRSAPQNDTLTDSTQTSQEEIERSWKETQQKIKKAPRFAPWEYRKFLNPKSSIDKKPKADENILQREAMRSFYDLAGPALSELRSHSNSFNVLALRNKSTAYQGLGSAIASPLTLNAMRRKVNALSKASSTLDLHLVSNLSAGIEALLQTFCETPSKLNTSSARTLSKSIEILDELIGWKEEEQEELLEPPRVAVVDDDPVSLQSILNALVKTHLLARPFHDAVSASKVFSKEPFDLIILDIRMPKMSGFEVYERLKSTPMNSKTPFIFVTSMQDFQDQAKTRTLGGADMIAKPFIPIELAVKSLSLIIREHIRANDSRSCREDS